ncbi:unnamed protein product [Paramecium pentaurelia]|uniref:Uncharacterized protein n=1 Tax=Paramecium pentaurelia TaxID=43138 RepID=A0A8S1YEM7_9CILI|nr:unnamed protein product [Paramecium pentaurelia]
MYNVGDSQQQCDVTDSRSQCIYRSVQNLCNECWFTRKQSKQSEFGGRLFGELLMMVQKGETLQSLNDHVEELRKHLANDESEDEKYFNDKQQEMEATVLGFNYQIIGTQSKQENNMFISTQTYMDDT